MSIPSPKVLREKLSERARGQAKSLIKYISIRLEKDWVGKPLEITYGGEILPEAATITIDTLKQKGWFVHIDLSSSMITVNDTTVFPDITRKTFKDVWDRKRSTPYPYIHAMS